MFSSNEFVWLIVTGAIGAIISIAAVAGFLGVIGWLLWRGLMSVIG